jgi:hypothetical protein
MKKYEWRNYSDKYYFYDAVSGKVVGQAGKAALADIFFGVTYTGDYTYTIQDEKHLGQYISLEHAKKAVELFWDVQSRTLLESNVTADDTLRARSTYFGNDS